MSIYTHKDTDTTRQQGMRDIEGVCITNTTTLTNNDMEKETFYKLHGARWKRRIATMQPHEIWVAGFNEAIKLVIAALFLVSLIVGAFLIS